MIVAAGSLSKGRYGEEKEMQTGAVIVAAGMSSRMGDFKPMLNIGAITIAQRVVATFQQAGIQRIVMVTGYQAQMLERHLAGNGIVFLRNENYETTKMFDSVKIGLEYMRDKCDRVLFTPVDIPLFTADTVRALMDSNAPLCCPVCDGETGHPVMIATDLVDLLLGDSGEKMALAARWSGSAFPWSRSPSATAACCTTRTRRTTTARSFSITTAS